MSVKLPPVSLLYISTYRGDLVLDFTVAIGGAAGAHKVMVDREQLGGDGAGRGVLAAVAKKGDNDTMEPVNGHPLVLLVHAAAQNKRLLGAFGSLFAGLSVCAHAW